MSWFKHPQKESFTNRFDPSGKPYPELGLIDQEGISTEL
jgi:hypothetical protein